MQKRSHGRDAQGKRGGGRAAVSPGGAVGAITLGLKALILSIGLPGEHTLPEAMWDPPCVG